MVNGIRASNLSGLNKGHGSKFYGGSRFRQEIPEEGWKLYEPKREYNKKYEDNNSKILNDKNHQALFQIYKQHNDHFKGIFSSHADPFHFSSQQY